MRERRRKKERGERGGRECGRERTSGSVLPEDVDERGGEGGVLVGSGLLRECGSEVSEGRGDGRTGGKGGRTSRDLRRTRG